MSTLSSAEALIEQFSHALGIPGLALDQDGLMALRAGDDVLVQIAHDAATGSLTLSSEVHPSADALPPSALRRMLVTNVKLMTEEGPAFAIDPNNGTAVLEHHIPLQDLDYNRFESIWITYIDQVERARTKLGQLVGASTSTSEVDKPANSDQLFVLRV